MTEDTFKIFKVDEKTMLSIQFAISSLEPLVKFVELVVEKYANYYIVEQEIEKEK